MPGLRAEIAAALRRAGTVPEVGHLPCDLITDGEAGEYMRRFYVRNPRRGPGARFHRIIASDPGPWLHDHPWDNVSVLLCGSYDEITPGGVRHWEAPCVIERRAELPHRLIVAAGEPVWTYFLTGPFRRRWGFHTEAGWRWHREVPTAAVVRPCAAPAPQVYDRW